MKKHLFLPAVIILFSCFAANSQKVFYLAPSLGFTNSTMSYSSDSNSGDTDQDLYFNLSVPFGFFIGEHVILGLETGYSYEVDKDFNESGGETGETSYSTVKIGPFFRFQTNMTEKTKFFLHVNSLFGFGSIKDEWSNDSSGESGEYETTTFILNPGVSPGVSLNLSETIMLEIMLGRLYYNSHTTTPKDSDNNFSATASEFGFKFWNCIYVLIHKWN